MRKYLSRAICNVRIVRYATFVMLTTVVYFLSQVQLGFCDNKPPFSWTADTVFDIIRTGDESAFSCLEDAGRGDRQIWDKRVNGEPVVNAFLFIARYTDGTNIEIAINPEFVTREKAE